MTDNQTRCIIRIISQLGGVMLTAKYAVHNPQSPISYRWESD